MEGGFLGYGVAEQLTPSQWQRLKTLCLSRSQQSSDNGFLLIVESHMDKMLKAKIEISANEIDILLSQLTNNLNSCQPTTDSASNEPSKYLYLYYSAYRQCVNTYNRLRNSLSLAIEWRERQPSSSSLNALIEKYDKSSIEIFGGLALNSTSVPLNTLIIHFSAVHPLLMLMVKSPPASNL